MNEFLKLIDERIEKKSSKIETKSQFAVVQSVNDDLVEVRFSDDTVYSIPNRSGTFVNIGDTVKVEYQGNAINSQTAYIRDTQNNMVVCSQDEYDINTAKDNVLYFIEGSEGGETPYATKRYVDTQDKKNISKLEYTTANGKLECFNTNNESLGFVTIESGSQLTKTVEGTIINITDGEIGTPFNSVYIEKSSNMLDDILVIDEMLNGTASEIGVVELGTFNVKKNIDYGFQISSTLTQQEAASTYGAICYITDTPVDSNGNITGRIYWSNPISTNEVHLYPDFLSVYGENTTVYVYFKIGNPNAVVSNLKIEGKIAAEKYYTDIKYADLSISTAPAFIQYKIPIGETVTIYDFVHKYSNEQLTNIDNCQMTINYNLLNEQVSMICGLISNSVSKVEWNTSITTLTYDINTSFTETKDYTIFIGNCLSNAKTFFMIDIIDTQGILTKAVSYGIIGNHLPLFTIINTSSGTYIKSDGTQATYRATSTSDIVTTGLKIQVRITKYTRI